LSPAGQGFVHQEGFVEQVAHVTKIPKAEQILPKVEDRIDMNFRFRFGSSQLDNKALDDVDRLVIILNERRESGSGVILVGFADSRGTEAANKRISEERAQVLKAALQERGIEAGATTGFGSALPVADNDTEDGRTKNRRVEVWIRPQ
jgi:phosphate transport system substrate-binding protein